MPWSIVEVPESRVSHLRKYYSSQGIGYPSVDKKDRPSCFCLPRPSPAFPLTPTVAPDLLPQQHHRPAIVRLSMPNDMNTPELTSQTKDDKSLSSRILPSEFYDQFLSQLSKHRIEDPSLYTSFHLRNAAHCAPNLNQFVHFSPSRNAQASSPSSQASPMRTHTRSRLCSSPCVTRSRRRKYPCR